LGHGSPEQVASEAGRDSPPEVTIHQVVAFGGGPASVGSSGERRLGHGSPEQVASDLNVYSGLGIRTVVCNFRSADVPALRSAMETFAAAVMPQVSGG
jgi:hypothetical protein